MKLYSVEGNTQKLDGGAMFGNAPRPMWEGWAMPDERNRISLACRALLVETDDGQRILFEAGVGAFFEPKLKERFGVVEEEHVLLRSLSDLGLSDAVIDADLGIEAADGEVAPVASASAPRRRTGPAAAAPRRRG